jgi:4-amino-4-deoxy-L-arabinose transferase-like glycosyltransferase
MTTVLEPPAPPAYGNADGHEAVHAPDANQRRPSWSRRLVRGRPEDPSWVRPALLGLLALTAVLYLWDLGASGWANSFYSAAVQAGTKSWKAFFFGSSDASNFITVDKPPASLWVMELSARMFGVNTWSILVPQALEGVATVAVVYATVRRWFSAKAGLLAGAVMATTPVAVLIFRFNNPDALLVLLLSLAAYATVRSIEKGRTVWLALAMGLVGLGFITKMLQAFVVVPAFAAAFLLAAPIGWWKRVGRLALSGVALLVSSFWWVAAVQLTPAADRPYVGGSQHNSILNLIFGYNGFGRLTGNETGSVGGQPGGGTSMWGPTGWTRMFNSSFGGQISWLLPAALLLLVAALILTIKGPRTDRTRAAFVLWGGWLVVTGVTFSLAQGIIHPYYTVALAPAVAALAGMGSWLLWQHRRQWFARTSLAVVVLVTGWWSYALLQRSPNWVAWLHPLMLVCGVIGAVLIMVQPYARHALAHGLAVATAAVCLTVALGGPVAYAVNTARTPHNGALPTAGPATANGGFGGFGGGPGARAGGFPFAGGTGNGSTRGQGNGFFPALGGRGTAGTGQFPGGQLPNGGPMGGAFAGGNFAPPSGVAGGGFGGATGRRGQGGPGGILSASTPSKQVTQALQRDAGRYKWVLATVSANNAAGYQLASGDPVMAIGGFNGTDPAPTLKEFEADVARHQIHYFVAGGGGLGGGLRGGGIRGFGGAAASSGGTAGQITSWVEAHFKKVSINGTTLYDLTQRTS